MSDYSKLNIRFTNQGLSLANDPTVLPFGKYTVLENIDTNVEGQLTGRQGLANVSITDAATNIIGIRRLNDAVQNKSTYLSVDDSGNLYKTTGADGKATTTTSFLISNIGSGFGSTFGSFYMYRPNLSNQVWAYVASSTKMERVSINAAGTTTTASVGIAAPTSALIWPSAYVAGTVAVTIGSAEVVGTGTAWTSDMNGRAITVNGVSGFYVLTVNSGTDLTLTTIWPNASAIAQPYSIRAESNEAGTHLTLNALYYYIYTLYDSTTGIESRYNYVQGGVSDPLMPTVVYNAFVITLPTQTVPSNVTHARIYRLATAPATPTDGLYHFVGQVPYTGTSTTFLDDFSDTTVTSATSVNFTGDQPFTVILQGTYTVTNGSTAVLGTGTNWSSAMNGTVMNILGILYIINTVTSATALTITTAYTGATQAGISGLTMPGQPLPYLFGPINGYMLATGDTNNPGYVYWSDKFAPDVQDPANNLEVVSPNDPIMNGFIYNGQAFVFTKETLYQLIPGLGSDTFTPFKTICNRGLIASHAFAIGPEIYFLSKDGIYATSGNTERPLIDDSLRPIFRGQFVYSTQTYAPIDFTQTAFLWLAFHQNHIYFQYKDTNGGIQWLIYSILYNRWSSYRFRTGTQTIYSDEESTSALFFGADSTISQLTGNVDLDFSQPPFYTNSIPARLTTGFITVGSPLIHKEWGAIVFDMNGQGTPVTINVLANKGLVSIGQGTFTNNIRTRNIVNLTTLGDALYEDIQIDITWNGFVTAPPIMYGYALLYKPDTVLLTRWANLNVDHGIQGWQILRSLYLTLRSDGACYLNITADNGTTSTYQIAGTNGNKQKIFVPLNPTKGMLFKYELVLATALGAFSATYFRLYNEDCEVHVKPWVSSSSYRIENPFLGGDAMTPPLQIQNS